MLDCKRCRDGAIILGNLCQESKQGGGLVVVAECENRSAADRLRRSAASPAKIGMSLAMSLA